MEGRRVLIWRPHYGGTRRIYSGLECVLEKGKERVSKSTRHRIYISCPDLAMVVCAVVLIISRPYSVCVRLPVVSRTYTFFEGRCFHNVVEARAVSRVTPRR